MDNQKYNITEVFKRMDDWAASPSDPAQTVKSCFAEMVNVLKPERGFMELYDSKLDELAIFAGHNIDIDQFSYEAISFTLLDKVYQEQEPVLTVDAIADPRFEQTSSVILAGLRSTICAPVMTEKGLIGLVFVDNRQKVGHYKKEDLQFIEDCCRKLAEIIMQRYPEMIARQKKHATPEEPEHHPETSTEQGSGEAELPHYPARSPRHEERPPAEDMQQFQEMIVCEEEEASSEGPPS
jgi:signal transduction protein with GAF and PtsI domain